MIAATDSALAALNKQVETATDDALKTIVRNKLDGLKSHLSTPDQRVLAALIESLASETGQECGPLRKVSDADLKAATLKTSGDFGILFADCK
jgi:DNA polymerase III epsilon subunit-like protein